MASVSERLRQAIDGCGMSWKELSRQSGVALSVISRFMSGNEMRTGNVDRLCETLGLTLTAKGRRKAKPRKGH